MQGVYFDVPTCRSPPPTSQYPGLALYLKEMKKYEPKYVEDEVAIQGWESAALFVAGVKAAGNNLTQATVIKQTNSLTDFTAGGLTGADQLELAGHAGTRRPTAVPTSWPRALKYVPALEALGKNVFDVLRQRQLQRSEARDPVPAGE